ncbi:MAG: hypothetical protein RUMPE_00104 [Eubacteriales bacterium SKADARSKE-1]|nr:hypothetical protein [Eubacteriales bacterium SKADARSKE-1]
MEQSQNLITTTYLITREDYVNLSISKLKIDGKSPYTRRQKVVSFIIIFFVSLFFFRPGELSSIILCALIIFSGYFFLFIFDMYMVKKLAANIYEKEKNNLLSQTFSLYEDGVSIKTDKYSANIPFNMLYKVYEDDEVFIVCTSIVDMKFVPKRAIDAAQCNVLKGVLQKELKDNFVKL